MKNNFNLLAKLKKTELVTVDRTVVRVPRGLTEADLRSAMGGADTCCACCVDDCGEFIVQDL